jgi:hypothetical protein
MGKWKIKFWGSQPEAGPADEDLPEAPSDGDGANLESMSAQSASPSTSPSQLSTPRPEVEHALSLLRDIEGVVGSIAVANTGQLLGSDLPRLFDVPATEALAMRLNQVRAKLAGAHGPLKNAAFRYETHALYVSQLASGLLGVLAESSTHEPALDMATRLVGQRVDAVIGATA